MNLSVVGVDRAQINEHLDHKYLQNNCSIQKTKHTQHSLFKSFILHQTKKYWRKR